MITYDAVKREATLEERGLDFADAAMVFAGVTLDREDSRKDYGEARVVTLGHLRERLVAIVWTPTANGRRIISMRKANGREQTRFRLYFES